MPSYVFVTEICADAYEDARTVLPGVYEVTRQGAVCIEGFRSDSVDRIPVALCPESPSVHLLSEVDAENIGDVARSSGDTPQAPIPTTDHYVLPSGRVISGRLANKLIHAARS